MCSVSSYPCPPPRRALLALLLGLWGLVPGSLAQSLPQATGAPAQGWEQWFYGQRLYGLGYIPEDALPNALAQRDAMRSAARFGPQSLQQSLPESAITEGRWFSIGPAGINSFLGDVVSGRVNSLAIDPLNPATVYVAAAGGGVWKSTNRGSRWVALTDNLPSLASGAVAVDPFSGEVWYGTGELNFCRDCYYGAGVFRSSDGGANWTRVNPESFLSSPTSVIVFDRRNRGTVFIGRSTALWKSSDGGQTWRVVLRGVVTDFVLHPVDSSIAYAAIGNFSGSPENGVYRSADGGETWIRLTVGLPPQDSMGRIALAAAPTEPSTVYALIVRSTDFNLNGLFRSLNGGESWSALGSLPADIFLEEGQGQGLFHLFVEVDPRDAAVLYVGGVELWKSADFGAAWENLSVAARLHEDQRDIVFDPADRQTFYLIGDSGVWRSSDGGRSFINLNSTLAVTQFQTVGLHPTNPNLAVGGTQDNGTTLYRGGSVWEQGRPGDSGAAFFDRANPQTLYTVARWHSLRRSDDGGKTFRLISEGLDPSDRVLFYPPFLQDSLQPEILYFATHRVWQSLDRGEHWQPLSGDLTSGGSATISALAVAHLGQVLYAGTSDGRVHMSPDGGRSWSPAGPLPNRFVTSLAVDPRLPQRAVLGFSGFGTGHVFRTDNRGGNWEDISQNLPDIPVNVVLFDAASPETIYAGTDIGVFVLTPGGSWAPLKDGMPNAVVLGLAQNPATGLLVAATHGRGAFAIALGGPATNAPRLVSLANGASLEIGPLAPGMVTALFGSNEATSTIVVTSPPPLPVSLAGTTVLVNDIAAPLFSVSPTQVYFQVPYGVTGPMAEVRLRTELGEASVRIARSDASPGIFASGGEASIWHTNNTRVTDVAPARPGEDLILFANGLGAVDPPVPSGAAAPISPIARTLSLPTIRVGDIPAEVRFSGLAAGFVGFYQVNFVVPAGVSGRVPVSLEMAGLSSNTVFLSVLP